jgi:hypothetical protein
VPRCTASACKRPRILGKHAAARALAGAPQFVFAVTARALLAQHGHDLLLSPINSGSTLRAASPRSSDPFSSVAEFPWERKQLAEVTVRRAIPDVMRYVESVET